MPKAFSVDKKERGSVRCIGDRSANPNREVELDHSPALPLPQGVEKFQNRCVPNHLLKVSKSTVPLENIIYIGKYYLHRILLLPVQALIA
jgi:hypothetical protein